MAAFSASAGVEVIYWTVSNLASDFIPSLYSMIGIRDSDGTILDYNTPSESNVGVRETGGSVTVPPGTYTITGFTQVLSGGVFDVGTRTVIVKSNRPSNWSWQSYIASGSPINISANEWNDFCAKINEFRIYSGVSEYSFTWVYSGMNMSANIINQAWNAINGIDGSGTLPSKAVSGGEIKASFFYQLQDALNQIK